MSIGIVLYVVDCWLTFEEWNTYSVGARIIFNACRENTCLQYHAHALQLTLA